MPDSTFLSWPFFEDTHRALARDLDAWCKREIAPLEGREDEDLDDTCREIVRRLGDGGWLRLAAGERLDVRSLCVARETLARHSGLADFSFALQGLGSGPLSLFGTEEQRRVWLPRVARGE
ncbi:MAG: acyl-CoA dehydrogenase family protein, partial [Thermoanaerobaculia bacterium]